MSLVVYKTWKAETQQRFGLVQKMLVVHVRVLQYISSATKILYGDINATFVLFGSSDVDPEVFISNAAICAGP